MNQGCIDDYTIEVDYIMQVEHVATYQVTKEGVLLYVFLNDLKVSPKNLEATNQKNKEGPNHERIYHISLI